MPALRWSKTAFSPAYVHVRTSLRAAREARGLTQDDLAEALGVSQSFISKYERGERHLDLVEVIRLSAVLDLDLDLLVTETHQLVEAT